VELWTAAIQQILLMTQEVVTNSSLGHRTSPPTPLVHKDVVKSYL